jgi:hypothetical protein
MLYSIFRLKDVAQPQYSQKEAELAAGKTIEVLPPVRASKETTVEMKADDEDL